MEEVTKDRLLAPRVPAEQLIRPQAYRSRIPCDEVRVVDQTLPSDYGEAMEAFTIDPASAAR